MGNDWNSTDGKNTKTLIYVRNISAGAAQDVLVRTRSRVIANRTPA
jgi:hypothetical protein